MVRSERHLVAHLLRRAGFGSSAADLSEYMALGFEGAVERLINYTDINDSALDAAIAAT